MEIVDIKQKLEDLSQKLQGINATQEKFEQQLHSIQSKLNHAIKDSYAINSAIKELISYKAKQNIK